MTACHEQSAIMTLVRHIEAIKKTLSGTQNHQEKTCTEHKLRDVWTHCTLSLTVRKVTR